MSLLLTFLLGLFFVAGILIIRLTSKYGVVEQVSIALACGAMVALLSFDLVPEIVESYELSNIWQVFVFIAAGMAALKLLDIFVPEHGDHDDASGEGLIHIGIMTAVAVSLHNILEGMTVYNMADKDILSGASLAFGVGLHNIPMGMLIFAMLKKESRGKKVAILLCAVLSTFVGGLLMMALRPFLSETVINSLVCVTIGMVLFIIFFELIPAIIGYKRKAFSVIFLVAGFGLVFLSSMLLE